MDQKERKYNIKIIYYISKLAIDYKDDCKTTVFDINVYMYKRYPGLRRIGNNDKWHCSICKFDIRGDRFDAIYHYKQKHELDLS